MNELIIEIYKTSAGKLPYNIWLDDLEKKTQAIIQTRLDRVTAGNFGDCTPLKDNLFELRIDYGPGYRVYFGKVGNRIVLLLNGGDKRSQKRDIEKAREYWLDYREKS